MKLVDSAIAGPTRYIIGNYAAQREGTYDELQDSPYGVELMALTMYLSVNHAFCQGRQKSWFTGKKNHGSQGSIPGPICAIMPPPLLCGLRYHALVDSERLEHGPVRRLEDGRPVQSAAALCQV